MCITFYLAAVFHRKEILSGKNYWKYIFVDTIKNSPRNLNEGIGTKLLIFRSMRKKTIFDYVNSFFLFAGMPTDKCKSRLI